MIIKVLLDKKTFKTFTRFDILYRRKPWKSPVLFMAIISFCAAVCFIMHNIDGAVFLGTVLLLVGFGMPIVYFVSFAVSLEQQVKIQKLIPPRHVYTLTLTENKEGILVSNETDSVSYPWAAVYKAYQAKDCTYLFITEERGFLLPHQCVTEGSDALWKFLTAQIPDGRCIVL